MAFVATTGSLSLASKLELVEADLEILCVPSGRRLNAGPWVEGQTEHDWSGPSLPWDSHLYWIWPECDSWGLDWRLAPGPASGVRHLGLSPHHECQRSCSLW